MRIPLTQEQLERARESLPEWRLEGAELIREVTFRDFAESFAFLTRVALIAQRDDHHPDMFVSWSKVRLSLSTHSVGAITELDIKAARSIEALLS